MNRKSWSSLFVLALFIVLQGCGKEADLKTDAPSVEKSEKSEKLERAEKKVRKSKSEKLAEKVKAARKTGLRGKWIQTYFDDSGFEFEVRDKVLGVRAICTLPGEAPFESKKPSSFKIALIEDSGIKLLEDVSVRASDENGHTCSKSIKKGILWFDIDQFDPHAKVYRVDDGSEVGSFKKEKKKE